MATSVLHLASYPALSPRQKQPSSVLRVPLRGHGLRLSPVSVSGEGRRASVSRRVRISVSCVTSHEWISFDVGLTQRCLCFGSFGLIKVPCLQFSS